MLFLLKQTRITLVFLATRAYHWSNREPWGTSLVTGVQLPGTDHDPLPVSHSSIHLTVHSSWVCLRGCCERVSNAFHGSPGAPCISLMRIQPSNLRFSFQTNEMSQHQLHHLLNNTPMTLFYHHKQTWASVEKRTRHQQENNYETWQQFHINQLLLMEKLIKIWRFSSCFCPSHLFSSYYALN